MRRACVLFLRTAVAATLVSSLGFGYDKNDVPEGWAAQGGGTTGGHGGTEVTVSSMDELRREAGSSGKKIILVKKGKYSGALEIESDKSILGLEPGVEILGNIRITGANNVIVRNLAVQDEKCESYAGCRSGTDAVYIGDGSKNVWLDHLDVRDGQDGNCDITRGPDFITITWCKFWYTYAKEHAFASLIAGSDNESVSEGKLNITYAYCWWADNLAQRQPRGRYGKVHVLNNLYTSARSEYNCGPGHKMQMLIENNAFLCPGKAVNPIGAEPHNWKTVGNIGTAEGKDSNQGSVFTPPYSISMKMAATEVEDKVKAWAGNVMTLGQSDPLVLGPPASENRNLLLNLSPDGRGLVNTGAAAYGVTVLGIDGKTLVPRTRIDAGGALVFPFSGSSVLIWVEGVGRATFANRRWPKDGWVLK